MRGRTQIISIAIHVVVFGILFSISQGRSRRRVTAVAVVNGEKKKAEPKKEPPKPKPMLASARPKELPQNNAPKPVEAKPVQTAHEAAPVETNVEMGNDDSTPGISLGGPAPAKKEGPHDAQPQKKEAPAVKKEKVVAPKGDDNPEADSCTEAPSKPVPVQRSEIEYTQEARANGVEGRLVLRITVGSDGSVIKVEVVGSVDPALDAAAIATVKTWVFKPSMRCGKAMQGGTFMLAQRFELGD